VCLQQKDLTGVTSNKEHRIFFISVFFFFWTITPETELHLAADPQDSNYLSLGVLRWPRYTLYQQSFHWEQISFPYLRVSEAQVCSAKWLCESGIWRGPGEASRGPSSLFAARFLLWPVQVRSGAVTVLTSRVLRDGELSRGPKAATRAERLQAQRPALGN